MIFLDQKMKIECKEDGPCLEEMKLVDKNA